MSSSPSSSGEEEEEEEEGDGQDQDSDIMYNGMEVSETAWDPEVRRKQRLKLREIILDTHRESTVPRSS